MDVIMADDPRWVGRSSDFVDTNDLADECITNSPARVMVLDSSTDGPRLSFTATHITVYGGFEVWPRTSGSISTDAVASWIIDHDSTVTTKFLQRDRIDINFTEPVCDTVLFQTSLPDPGHHHLDVTLTPLAEQDNVILYIYNVTLSGSSAQSVTSSRSSSATVHGTSITTNSSRGTTNTAAQSITSPVVTSSSLSSAATDTGGAGPLIRQKHGTGSVKWYAAVVTSILAVLVALAVLAIFRRRRKQRRSKQAAGLNPYNDALRDDAHDVDAAPREVKMQQLEMKERNSLHPFTHPELPGGSRDEATKNPQLRRSSAEVSGTDGEVEETVDALVEAVQEAGFSVAALMKSLRRVRHRGDRSSSSSSRESDSVAPPTYDGLDSTG